MATSNIGLTFFQSTSYRKGKREDYFFFAGSLGSYLALPEEVRISKMSYKISGDTQVLTSGLITLPAPPQAKIFALSSVLMIEPDVL